MILRKADLYKLVDGTEFEIINDGTRCTLEIVNNIPQIVMGIEIIALEEEFNKNEDIRILNKLDYYYNLEGVEIEKADLFKLKDGVKFHAINGAWDGTKRILNNEHFIIHEKGKLEIDDSFNHSLDIRILGK